MLVGQPPFLAPTPTETQLKVSGSKGPLCGSKALTSSLPFSSRHRPIPLHCPGERGRGSGSLTLNGSVQAVRLLASRPELAAPPAQLTRASVTLPSPVLIPSAQFHPSHLLRAPVGVEEADVPVVTAAVQSQAASGVLSGRMFIS